MDKEALDADEDAFKRTMRLQREAELRVSSQHAKVQAQHDQLEELLEEPSEAYASDDYFS